MTVKILTGLKKAKCPADILHAIYRGHISPIPIVDDYGSLSYPLLKPMFLQPSV